MSHRPLKTGYNHDIHCYKGPEMKIYAEKSPKRTKNAKFVTICRKIGKSNGNESLQNISALQYTFMPHRPLKTVLNHNIH